MIANQPPSVTADSRGGLYVADRDNHRVLYFANDGDTTVDWVFGFKLNRILGFAIQLSNA